MLKAMRSNLKSLAPLLWLVIIAFVISIFAVWGAGGLKGEGGGKKTLAIVGKEKISSNFYYSTLIQRLQAMSEEFKDLNAKFIQQLNIPQQVLEQMIQSSLLLQKAKDMDLHVAKDEIVSKIVSYPVFQKDNQFIGFDQYQKILSWNRISLSEFEKSLEKEILTEKVIKMTTAGIFVTEEEIWKNYVDKTESAKIEYAILEADSIELEKEPEESEIKDYFQSKKENYKLSERRQADYVFFNSDDLKKEVQVTDSEIIKYYKDNKDRFKEPAQIRISRIFFSFKDKNKESVKKEAQNIHSRLQEKEDFGLLAEIYSQDDKASVKGDWGLYEWRTLPLQEQDAINKLELEEITNLIETQEGISILKATEKTPEQLTPVEELTDRITSILKDEKAKNSATNKAAKLKKEAKKQKSLNKAAQKLGFKIEKTGILENGDAIDLIDPSGSISNSIFQLEDNGLSSPIHTIKGVGIAQLTRIDSPRMAEFDEVQEQVKKDSITEKKKKVAQEKMNLLKNEIKNNSLEALAEKYKMKYETMEEHKRGQYLGTIGENPTVDNLSFSLNLNELSTPIEYEKGFVSIRVLGRKEISKEDYEKNKKAESEALLEGKKNKLIQSFLAKWREEKKVKIKYNVFQKISNDVLSRFSKEDEE